MMDYIVSFICFGGYLLLEHYWIKKYSENLFNAFFFIVGIVGIFITNIYQYKYFEYFFILVFIYSLIFFARKWFNKKND